MVVVEVTLHSLCNAVAGKVFAQWSNGKVVAAALAAIIQQPQNLCQPNIICINAVVTTNHTALAVRIGKLILILRDLTRAIIHGGIFVISVEQVRQDTLTNQIISGAVCQANLAVSGVVQLTQVKVQAQAEQCLDAVT